VGKHLAYGSNYQRRLKGLLQGPPVSCAHCRRQRATTLDHDPPIAMHLHREGANCCRLVPSCEGCNREGGRMVANGTWRQNGSPAATEGPPPERDGLDARDRRWRVPWLSELRRVPPDATWPRLMTVPHPRAVGSLGPAFIAWCAQRSGRELRWWQQLVATRLLEIDADGRLVWETALVSTARQVGKSWLLRELCLWRIHQGERFGEAQDVLHTGKDLAVCKEVQRPARIWAKARRDTYRVREVNGQEEIERLEDGARWMLRAKEAVYGYSVSLGVVDEGWKVRASSVDEGLTPTMAEREQAQLLLVSTAHRKATALMLGRRQVALEQLEHGDGDLLIEWSAPAGVDTGDQDAWRQASPHWSPRRERLVSKRHDAMLAGDVDDPDEPDPVESFRTQWLNQWPRRRLEETGATEPLLGRGVWDGLRLGDLEPAGPVWVALEDDYGLGAAVACCRRLSDGRLELDGWLRGDWDSAIADAQALVKGYNVRRLLVGASLMDRVPPGLRALADPRGTSETRTGLALLRDLAQSGQVTHDHGTTELDDTLAIATVREAPAGLVLVAKGPTHLVRAAVWALAAAHRPSAVPAVH
jgi:hypothetical protein